MSSTIIAENCYISDFLDILDILYIRYKRYKTRALLLGMRPDLRALQG